MRTRRAIIVVVAVWVAVVMVGSTMVWAVISRAGREVAAVSDPNTVAGTVLHRSPSDAPTIKPGDTISHRPRHHGDDDDDDDHGDDDHSAPSSPTTSAPSSSPGGSSKPGASHEPSSSPAGPKPVQATWNGRPGTITLECTGTRRTELVVVPANGYRWEVDDATASSVKVKFERVGSESETEISAYCSAGQPRFRVDESHEDDEDVHDDH